MKKILVAAFALAVATSASAAISGTSHDMIAHGATSATMTVCQFCHAPHVSTATNVGASTYLWNRNVGTATANTTSNRCFTCHAAGADAYAVNNGGDATNSFTVAASQQMAAITNHPVGVTYATSNATLYGLIASPNAALLRSGNVECTSCHDPHRNAAKFYRAEYTSGGGCAACHNK